MITAPVNKIIPFSSVDGPGNRTAVFFRVVTGTAVIAITQRQEICAQAVWPVCRSVLWGTSK